MATAAWEAALDSRWDGPDVWVHGDVTCTNLLVADGRLAAVIDFGCCAVGASSNGYRASAVTDFLDSGDTS